MKAMKEILVFVGGNKYLICRQRLEEYLNQLMIRERNRNDVGLEENHGVN